jgi:glucosyl-dolichyl phosphate glucuronosyltransferase
VLSQPLLSVVITSYTNERLKDIFELLKSLKIQTYSNIEIVFVVERQRELYQSVKNYAKENLDQMIKVVFNDGLSGLSESRNLGITHSQGAIIGFVDDDVVLSKSWAEEMVKTFSQDDNIIGVTGPAFPLWEDESLSWLPEELHWVISCTTWFDKKGICPIRNAWGHNMAFKRAAFDACGLFPNKFGYHRGEMAEDLGFSLIARMKTGKDILYNSEVVALHRVHGYRLSWRFIIERSMWIGHSRRALSRFYKGMNDTPFTMEYSILRRIVMNVPLKIFRAISRKPSKGPRMLAITTLMLASVALGYIMES